MQSQAGRAAISGVLVIMATCSVVFSSHAASVGTTWAPAVRIRAMQSSDLGQPPFVLPELQKNVRLTPPVFPPPQATSPDVDRLRELNTPRTGTSTVAPEPPPPGLQRDDRTPAVATGIDGGVPLLQPVDELPRFDHWDRPLVVPANAPEPFPVTVFMLIHKDGLKGLIYGSNDGGARTEVERQLARDVLHHVAFNGRFKPARRAGQPVDCWVAVAITPPTH